MTPKMTEPSLAQPTETTVTCAAPLDLLIAPAWMVETLERENCSMDILNDIDKLTDIFSMCDLGLYCYVNRCRGPWLGDAVLSSFRPPAIIESLLNKEDVKIGYQSHVINQPSDEISARHSSDLLGPLCGVVSPSDICFQVKPLGMNAVVLVPELRQTLNMDYVRLLDDLLYVANMHMSMEGLAKLPLFKQFLNSV